MANRRLGYYEDDSEGYGSESEALSPYEQALGGAWDEPGSIVTPEAVEVYESGGADYGGPAPEPSRRDIDLDSTETDPRLEYRHGEKPSERTDTPTHLPTGTEVSTSDVVRRAISGGGSTSAPDMPKEPTPTSTQPRTFSPMTESMAMAETAMPRAAASPAPGARASVYAQRRPTNLFGRAGGLLGGGLGLPTSLGGGRDNDPSSLIEMLRKVLQGGGY